MAYLDDNNDNLYTQGNPLDELDKELAELQETLRKLDQTDTMPDPEDKPS